MSACAGQGRVMEIAQILDQFSVTESMGLRNVEE